MSPGRVALSVPVMVLSSPLSVPMWPSMTGRFQISSPVSASRAWTAPTMPNSPPELPEMTMPRTMSGAAV